MDDKHTSRAASLHPDEKNGQLRGILDQVKMIATGGMAHIFKARQPSLERYIVVKKLKEELLANSEVTERFRREAKALASVLHQNVAHVYDFVEEGKDAFILMEFIEGVDLSTILEKVGNVPPDIAALVLLGVAKGVSYIHMHHLIHRDIKPSNIRLTNRGQIKLMDFGIVMEINNNSLTRPGMMVGSPSYLSPEQVLGDPISPKADTFLLGICLYEMLTGTRPFKEEGGKTVFQKIREAKFVSAREMNGKVSRELNQIVENCLKKDPEARYKNVKALIQDLERYLGSIKSSHSEDLILKFLDEEAMVTPAIPYTELPSDEYSIRDLFRGPRMWIFLAATLVAFAVGAWGGYRYGINSSDDEPVSKSHLSYPPSQPSKSR